MRIKFLLQLNSELATFLTSTVLCTFEFLLPKKHSIAYIRSPAVSHRLKIGGYSVD